MIKKIMVMWDNVLYKIIIRNLLKTSKLGHGFVVTGAESGENFEHLYNDKSEGALGIGKLIDRILLNLPAAQATRLRKNDVKNIVWNEIQNNALTKRKTKVLDLASGGARYLRELSDEHGQGLVESICVDKDKRCVYLGRSLAVNEGVANIKFLHGDVFKLDHLKRLAEKINWQPNLIVASGIFIYFNDETVSKFIADIYEFLPKDGALVFTSYENLNVKKLMRKSMSTSGGDQWTLYYRKPDFLRKVLYDIGFSRVYITRDQWLMNNVCLARK